jgi:hypothetical protein
LNLLLPVYIHVQPTHTNKERERERHTHIYTHTHHAHTHTHSIHIKNVLHKHTNTITQHINTHAHDIHRHTSYLAHADVYSPFAKRAFPSSRSSSASSSDVMNIVILTQVHLVWREPFLRKKKTPFAVLSLENQSLQAAALRITFV